MCSSRLRDDRVMDAIEYEEIRKLLGRYNLAIDLGDAAGWAATFAPEGGFRCTSLPDARPPAQGAHPPRGAPPAGGPRPPPAERSYRITKGGPRHWNANMVIEGDGET